MLDLALRGVSVVISLPNSTDCKAAQLLVTSEGRVPTATGPTKASCSTYSISNVRSEKEDRLHYLKKCYGFLADLCAKK